MPLTSHVRHHTPSPIDWSARKPAESVASGERNAYDRRLLGAHPTSPPSSIKSSDLRGLGSMFEAEDRVTPHLRPLDAIWAACIRELAPALRASIDAEREGESRSIARTERAPAPSQVPAREGWLRDAQEQLENLDVDALEEGLEPPSVEARRFADTFLREFAKLDLPLASVFADEHRGVSIQMEVTGFFFLLTCLEGGTGIYNIAHQTYRIRGSYKDLSIADVAGSGFFQHLRCLIKPLTKDARHTDRPE